MITTDHIDLMMLMLLGLLFFFHSLCCLFSCALYFLVAAVMAEDFEMLQKARESSSDNTDDVFCCLPVCSCGLVKCHQSCSECCPIQNPQHLSKTCSCSAHLMGDALRGDLCVRHVPQDAKLRPNPPTACLSMGIYEKLASQMFPET